MPTIHLHITGEVQGVFYRATAKKVADKIRITGWIKNNDDGSVEAVATGSEQQLNEFVAWCKKGPEKAMVHNVMVKQENEHRFDEFVVMRRR